MAVLSKIYGRDSYNFHIASDYMLLTSNMVCLITILWCINDNEDVY